MEVFSTTSMTHTQARILTRLRERHDATQGRWAVIQIFQNGTFSVLVHSSPGWIKPLPDSVAIQSFLAHGGVEQHSAYNSAVYVQNIRMMHRALPSVQFDKLVQILTYSTPCSRYCSVEFAQMEENGSLYLAFRMSASLGVQQPRNIVGVLLQTQQAPDPAWSTNRISPNPKNVLLAKHVGVVGTNPETGRKYTLLILRQNEDWPDEHAALLGFDTDGLVVLLRHSSWTWPGSPFDETFFRSLTMAADVWDCFVITSYITDLGGLRAFPPPVTNENIWASLFFKSADGNTYSNIQWGEIHPNGALTLRFKFRVHPEDPAFEGVCGINLASPRHL